MIRTIGRFQIESEIGRGAMGLVYRANDPVLRRVIALKTILLPPGIAPEAVEEFERRFFQEAQAAARLSHPAIVVVHDVGRDPETAVLYMALEFLDGRTIEQMTEGGRALDWRKAAEIAETVARGLYHASLMGVVHRDVKPANIMVLRSGESKIMDFGVAKVDNTRSKLTQAGESFGTPLYMSPEQAFGMEANHRSDLFSLGATLYRMLTGRDAFAAVSVAAIIKRVVDDEPELVSQVQPGVPRSFDLVTARVMSKNPENRYLNASELSDDLVDVLHDRSPRHASGRGPSALGAVTASPGEETLELIEDQAFDPAEEIARLVSSAPTSPTQSERRWPVPLTAASGPAGAASSPPPRPTPLGARPPGLSAQRLALALLVIVVGLAVAGLLRRKPGQEPLSEGPAASDVAPSTVAERPAAVATDGPRASPSASGGPATLLFDFDHGLKAGRLRVWVDDAVVVDEKLDSRVTRKVFGRQSRKGGFGEALKVGPGRHEVRVQVAWDDNERTRAISGTFGSGSTRRLSAKLGGIIDKSLSLDWE